MVKVAFQGELGAYSEEAVYQYFPASIELEPCKTLRDVFNLLKENIVDYAVVPIENSLEGSVNRTYDLLLEYDLKVCGEIHLRIIHCLIAEHGTKLSDIERVFSHPQALGQCTKFIERLGSEPVPTYDTAGSVMMLKEKKIKKGAAIASYRAAVIYGMAILAKGIEDDTSNYTRFFVLSETDAHPSGDDKTSIVFSVKHVPGSLYDALKAFATRKLNLTKIESRPTKQKPWEYYFYLDFEGHRTDEQSRFALRDLEEKTYFIKILGSYPKAKNLTNSVV
jgi:chorismate mutase/prephenate dehydratase